MLCEARAWSSAEKQAAMRPAPNLAVPRPACDGFRVFSDPDDDLQRRRFLCEFLSKCRSIQRKPHHAPVRESPRQRGCVMDLWLRHYFGIEGCLWRRSKHKPPKKVFRGCSAKPCKRARAHDSIAIDRVRHASPCQLLAPSGAIHLHCRRGCWKNLHQQPQWLFSGASYSPPPPPYYSKVVGLRWRTLCRRTSAWNFTGK